MQDRYKDDKIDSFFMSHSADSKTDEIEEMSFRLHPDQKKSELRSNGFFLYFFTDRMYPHYSLSHR